MSIDQLPNLPLAAILMSSIAQYFFGILLSVTAVFLILLVLVQRGRGGGLAGAFGGMGGQSAFGTKAGDTFTRVTIGVSIVWILLCVASVKMLGRPSGGFGQATAPSQSEVVPGPGGLDEPLLPQGNDAGTSLPSNGAAPGATLPGETLPATGPAAEVTPDTPLDATGSVDGTGGDENK